MKKKHLLYVPMIIISIIMIFPIFWAILTSFKPADKITSAIPIIFFAPTLSNYQYLVSSLVNFQSHLLNSVIIAAGATVLCSIIGTMAAYSINRTRFRGRANIAFFILSVRFIPPIVALIPLYVFYQLLGLYDTQLGLILVNTVFNLPIAVWLMQGFIGEIPKDLDEAAMMDGRSRLGALFHIVLPLAGPGAAVSGLFVFLFSWNEFLSALLLTSRVAIPASANLLQFLTVSTALWGPLMAAAITMWVPPFIVFAILQRRIVRGLTLGAVR